MKYFQYSTQADQCSDYIKAAYPTCCPLLQDVSWGFGKNRHSLKFRRISHFALKQLDWRSQEITASVWFLVYGIKQPLKQLSGTEQFCGLSFIFFFLQTKPRSWKFFMCCNTTVMQTKWVSKLVRKMCNLVKIKNAKDTQKKRSHRSGATL